MDDGRANYWEVQQTKLFSNLGIGSLICVGLTFLVVAQGWVERCKVDRNAAVAELMTFIVQVRCLKRSTRNAPLQAPISKVGKYER
jgi:hypothetical protein